MSNSIYGAEVIEEDGRQVLTFWPYCKVCKSPFGFDAEGSLASCNCGTTEWGNPRPASWVRPPLDDITEGMAHQWKHTEDFLIEYLRCWRDEGVPAPLNELQSIASWLRETVNVKEMQRKMRNRMVLLMRAARALNSRGIDAEVLAGIYKNRPDLEAEARKAVEEVEK